MQLDTNELAPALESVARITKVELKQLSPEQQNTILHKAKEVLIEYQGLLESLRRAWQAPTPQQFRLQSEARTQVEEELKNEGCDRIEYPSSPTEWPDPEQPDNYAILRQDREGKTFIRVKRTLETPSRQSLLEFVHELFALNLINKYKTDHPDESFEIQKRNSMQVGPVSISHVLDLIVQDYVKQP